MIRLGRKYLPAALILGLGSMVAPNGAEAARSAIIVNSQTPLPIADPVTQIDANLSLAPLTQLQQGDFIKFFAVPDVTSVTLANSVISGLFTESFSKEATSDLFDVTLTYSSPSIFSNPDPTKDFFLGDLLIDTTIPYPPPADLLPLNYSTQGHSFPDGALITFTTLVPEPASLAMIAIGIPSALLISRRFRSARR
jgi:hypothetical protein